jgi:hypothetical protein
VAVEPVEAHPVVVAEVAEVLVAIEQLPVLQFPQVQLLQ